MFAHSTLRSWRSLEILKVCPEKKNSNHACEVWAFQKSIREAVFFLGCHPRKKIERKGLEKSAFSVELPQNWCSPSYPPVQSS